MSEPASEGLRMAKAHAQTLDLIASDLERDMRGEKGAEKRAEFLHMLRAIDERLACGMKAGLSPSAFERNEILREALECARKIVVMLK